MRNLSCDVWKLVPWPRIELRPPALRSWSLSHCTTREVPPMTSSFFIQIKARSVLHQVQQPSPKVLSGYMWGVVASGTTSAGSWGISTLSPSSSGGASLRPVHKQLPEDWARWPPSVTKVMPGSTTTCICLPPFCTYPRFPLLGLTEILISGCTLRQKRAHLFPSDFSAFSQRTSGSNPQGRPLLGEGVCCTHGLQAQAVCWVSAQLSRGRLLTHAFHTTNHTIECDIQIRLRSYRERAAAQAWWWIYRSGLAQSAY